MPSYNLECQHVWMYILRYAIWAWSLFKHGYCKMQHTAKKWTRTFMFFKSKKRRAASVSYCYIVSDEIQKVYFKLYFSTLNPWAKNIEVALVVFTFYPSLAPPPLSLVKPMVRNGNPNHKWNKWERVCVLPFEWTSSQVERCTPF